MALSVVLLVQAAFVLSYVGALHAPKPHKVAIGVAGYVAIMLAHVARVDLGVSN